MTDDAIGAFARHDDRVAALVRHVRDDVDRYLKRRGWR
jgi:hypothetical protein